MKKNKKINNVTNFITRQECADTILTISHEVTEQLIQTVLTSSSKEFRELLLPLGPFSLLQKSFEYAQEVFHAENPCPCHDKKGKQK